ncbi:MAG: hypothetical protein JSR17_06870 [Proteobacteria bacterium]|nr:hypothetical protein [Pseudomonadota bacterium]
MLGSNGSKAKNGNKRNNDEQASNEGGVFKRLTIAAAAVISTIWPPEDEDDFLEPLNEDEKDSEERKQVRGEDEKDQNPGNVKKHKSAQNDDEAAIRAAQEQEDFELAQALANEAQAPQYHIPDDDNDPDFLRAVQASLATQAPSQENGQFIDHFHKLCLSFGLTEEQYAFLAQNYDKYVDECPNNKQVFQAINFADLIKAHASLTEDEQALLAFFVPQQFASLQGSFVNQFNFFLQFERDYLNRLREFIELSQIEALEEAEKGAVSVEKTITKVQEPSITNVPAEPEVVANPESPIVAKPEDVRERRNAFLKQLESQQAQQASLAQSQLDQQEARQKKAKPN